MGKTRLDIYLAVVSIGEIFRHNTIREIRKTHNHVLVGVLLNVVQTVLLVGGFFAMNHVMGSPAAIRGDLLIYLITGVFLFSIHVRAMSAVLAADGPTAPLMSHGPMSTTLAIASAAFGALYTQVYSMLIVLGLYHVLWEPIEIYRPAGFAGTVLLAWLSGVAIGIALAAVKPRFPSLASLAAQVYSRASMIGSGQMFVANMMPAYLLVWFEWNPLFHVIDQARGYAFLNYNPRLTSLGFPVLATLACLILGLLAEGHMRRHVSLSWFARR
ncbi:ABC transporter permease [Defluviimonas salinarum]|uniref:ABC transporter permease n=1 Tax=Defluviimonas salinarum TaxID=2992147 RepID=A0ABT3J8A8_9RHOB|nr:ABC transporter permease [Defluviimonas salinarum]MCW3783922.1 ABC transporter permease [Defluviimonas salinarum]